MTTKEEEPKEIQKNENVNQEEEVEKEEEEEEPVDLELQKEMKGLKISDSDFIKEPKTKKSQKKPKDPTIKKSKKKGLDLFDYANQNNIEINLEYEENKFQLKKSEDPKFSEKSNKYEKKPFNKNRQNKNWPQKKNKMSGNKFDMIQMRQYPHYNNYSQNIIQLTDDAQILEHLEKLLSEDNLNQNLYLRNRISNGKIFMDNIVRYNDFKFNNIDEKLGRKKRVLPVWAEVIHWLVYWPIFLVYLVFEVFHNDADDHNDPLNLHYKFEVPFPVMIEWGSRLHELADQEMSDGDWEMICDEFGITDKIDVSQQEISSVACVADKEDGSELEYWEWAGGGDSYGSACDEQVGTDINPVAWTDDDYQYLE